MTDTSDEFGCCPGCEKSWEHTLSESVSLGSAGGVLICNDCLNKPKGLDLERIKENLTRFGWAAKTVARAMVAIAQLKGAQ